MSKGLEVPVNRMTTRSADAAVKGPEAHELWRLARYGVSISLLGSLNNLTRSWRASG